MAKRIDVNSPDPRSGMSNKQKNAPQMLGFFNLNLARQFRGYLPLVSTFCFSSSFTFLTVGSWLLSPVVWVVVAGGLVLATEVCGGLVVAGRVAVLGGGLVWAATS